jgi:hypothetical protein
MAKCTLFKRHIWEKLGLDFYNGRLVRRRRCACGAVKHIPYRR